MPSSSSYPTQQTTCQPLAWNKALEARIMLAARKKPRYLFCSAILDDDIEHSAMLTHEGLVPQLFKKGFYGYSTGQAANTPPPSSIFSMPLKDVRYHNAVNFLARGPHSERSAMWSLWYSSLREATNDAVLREAMSARGGHKPKEVCILAMDTQTLSQDTLVLHESDKYLLESWNHASAIRDSFLAFGIIPADAFEKVTLSVLRKLVPCDSHPGSMRAAPIDIFDEQRVCGDLNHAYHIAKMFGQAFSPYLGLPVTCMAMTSRAGPSQQDDGVLDEAIEEGEIAVLFDEYEVPLTMLEDVTIGKEKPLLHVDSATRCGMGILRTVLKRQQERLDTKNQYLRFRMQIQTEELEPEDDAASTFSTPTPSTSRSTASDDMIMETAQPVDNSEGGILRAALLDAQRHTPRYLFRSWNNTDYLSGGYKGLNTIEAITPRAFLDKNTDAAASIHDLTKDQLREMCKAHLQTETDPAFMTQLSSWAASIHVAFRFARGKRGKNTYISIIDTQGLDQNNAIIHVPSLIPILGKLSGRTDTDFAWEYLAHGVISGAAHRAIPLEAFRKAGIPTQVSGLFTIPMSLCTTEEWSAKSDKGNITASEMRAAHEVAVQYGPKFGTPVLLALITLKQRSKNFWRDEEDLQRILPLFALATEDFCIPQTLCGDASILTDIVYTKDYENVEQMIRLLRGLVNWRHGRGARARRMAIAWNEGVDTAGEVSKKEVISRQAKSCGSPVDALPTYLEAMSVA